MTEETGGLIQTLLNSAWSIFQITVPGTTFTFAQMFIGLSVIGISLKILFVVFGFGGGSNSRTSSTDKTKISEERKHDDK